MHHWRTCALMAARKRRLSSRPSSMVGPSDGEAESSSMGKSGNIPLRVLLLRLVKWGAEAEAARRVVGWVMGVKRKRRRAIAQANEAEDPRAMLCRCPHCHCLCIVSCTVRVEHIESESRRALLQRRHEDIQAG